MPYINREDRHKYQDLLHKISDYVKQHIDDSISLNKSIEQPSSDWISIHIRNMRFSFMYFIITDLIDCVWGSVEKRRYSNHQDISGFLTCAKMEYHRRYVKKDIDHLNLFPRPHLLNMKPLSNYIKEMGSMVPKDSMSISGNMNYIISYLVDEIWGLLENRTDEDHFFIEYLLEDKSQIYYNLFTAPYEDKKIEEQGDLRDL